MAETAWADVPQIESVMDELLERLRDELLRLELSDAMARLRVAEKSADQGAIDEYLKKCQSISERLRGHKIK